MRKSQFVTFFLSMFPGLGHLYLGLPYRGMAFMAAFFGWMFFLFGLGGLVGINGAEALFFLAPLPVIWFYNVFDAMNLNQRINEGEQIRNHSPLQGLAESVTSGKKDAMWALLFGIVPGAGQMYLGWQSRGLQIMLMFFLCMSLVDWLHLSIFMFLLPVIWFYSFFDTMQLASGNADCPPGGSGLLEWVAQKQRWVGLGLIALGCVVLFDRVIAPFLDARMIEIVRTGVVAALFIGGGIRLAMGQPARPPRVPADPPDPPDQPGPGMVASNDDGPGGAQSCGNGE
ncbi:MAG: hypothetical protein ACM3X4_00390 [Ignavibacteriales bacterium]